MLEVYIDGACEPNPGGTAAWGAVVFKVIERAVHCVTEKVWENCGIVGSGPRMSNNVAEYAALLAFFDWFISGQHGISILTEVCIKSDSNLLVQQMSGKFKVHEGLYVPYLRRAESYFTHNPAFRQTIRFEWIPRTGNIADPLSVMALGKVGILRKGR